MSHLFTCVSRVSANSLTLAAVLCFVCGFCVCLCLGGWKLTPDCGSYFFSRASHSLGHLHPSRPGVVDPSDYARPASLLKWPATSPATRSRYAHLPHHQNPDAPPKLLPLFFCKWQRCLTSFFIYTALGDRQCFHARSALR